MTELLNLTLSELKDALQEMGEQPFRAGQVMRWLVQGVPFERMTDLSRSLRKKLEQNFREGYARILQCRKAADGTKKYLFALSDGNTVESVFMPKNYGNTVCVSTQVGCAMGCAFCASCQDGLKRGLTAGEILAQVVAVNADNGGGRAVDHIVLMGMGEPLDNFEQVIRFIGLVNAPEGLKIGQRNISLSTCGLTEQIERLADLRLQITLAISLHAAVQEKRERIMPTAGHYSIEEIVRAAHSYFEKTGRRIIIEYAMIADLNDSEEDALALAELLKGLACHVNLIPLNAWGRWKAPGKRAVYAFCSRLNELGLSATVRKSMGGDIEGACGQLRQRQGEGLPNA